jgi:signal transduction histidine kinase
VAGENHETARRLREIGEILPLTTMMKLDDRGRRRATPAGRRRPRETKSGSGPGLAIERDVVESHDGRLAFCRSTARGGLRVEAHLPARAAG